MSDELVWLDSEPEGRQNLDEFLQSTPSWDPWKWTLLKNWQELRERRPLALVCPLWIDSGSPFPPFDAAQLPLALPGVPIFTWLSHEQAELAWKASQSQLAGIFVRNGWGPPPWRELAESLCSVLKKGQLQNPLEGIGEVVAWQEQKVSYSFQCQDSELRGDLVNFLQLKAEMLGQTLGWEAQQLQLGGTPHPSRVIFSKSGTLLLVADSQGRAKADWDCYQNLRQLGFEL